MILLVVASALLMGCQGYSVSGRWMGPGGDPSRDQERAFSDKINAEMLGDFLRH